MAFPPDARLTAFDSTGSIVAKIDAETRQLIDESIVRRDPPTYRSAYERFQLHQRGISFTAFYYYARRLRFHAGLYEMARLVDPDSAAIAEKLPQLITHRLVEALAEPETSSRTLLRLAHAYRMVNQTEIAQRRLAFQTAHAAQEQQPESDDLPDLLQRLARFMRNRNASANPPPDAPTEESPAPEIPAPDETAQ